MWSTRFLSYTRCVAEQNKVRVVCRQLSKVFSKDLKHRQNLSTFSEYQFVYTNFGLRKRAFGTAPDSIQQDKFADHGNGNKESTKTDNDSNDRKKKYKTDRLKSSKEEGPTERIYEKQKRKFDRTVRPPLPKPIRRALANKSIQIQDPEMNLPYIKLSYDQPELPAFMMMTKSKVYRAQHHLLMIEGHTLLLEALQAGLELEFILYSRHEKIRQIQNTLQEMDSKPHIIRVPHPDMTFWSVIKTCPGVIGLFRKPVDMQSIYSRLTNDESNEEHSTDRSLKKSIQAPSITVIADQIRDPTNLGNIILTCASIPCKQVILTKGCADPWETKALRGGAGAQFRLPVRGPIDWPSITSILSENSDYTFFIADNNWVPRKIAQLESTTESDGEDDDQQETHVVPYSEVSFGGCNHIVLVIGGETEGISSEAYNVLQEQKRIWTSKEDSKGPSPQTIKIPLANGVESLNTSVAASILLFEIRRQMTLN